MPTLVCNLGPGTHMQVLGLEIDLIAEKSIFGMQAQNVAKWVIMDIYAQSGEGK